MIIKYIKPSEFHTVQWSGGKSTQLYIYPVEADYQEKKFDFRISTATIVSEESNFTLLSGVTRKLMVLEGEIEIVHLAQNSKRLKKFSQIEFPGDWETKSYGKAIDFNLMTTGSTRGYIEAIVLNKTDKIVYKIDPHVYFILFYAYKGTFSINLDTEIIEVALAGLCVVQSPKTNISQIIIEGHQNAEIIISPIFIDHETVIN